MRAGRFANTRGTLGLFLRGAASTPSAAAPAARLASFVSIWGVKVKVLGVLKRKKPKSLTLNVRR